ncbi:MAG: homoserine dehydrogenase [Proteobacteria bacterium]|nr:homoserine dehydrogenase [Pseudomonadota bacterium]
MKRLRVGVAGLGIVGSETVRILRGARGALERRLGAGLEIAAVCDRDVAREAKRLGLPAAVRRTRRWEDLVTDPSLDVLVETMGGLEEARGFVLGALTAGKRVVTANKRLLAHHWDEMFAAAGGIGRNLRFEASVAGGIPILEAVDQSLAANRIERVLGILNGTTNFILSRMEREGWEQARALKEAQALGLAEKDPTLDLNGTDAAHKIAVLAALLTGRGLRPDDVWRAGIGGITARDVSFARAELSRAPRLLGVVEIDWDADPATLTAYVAPTLVPLDHPLAGVHGEYNAILVTASSAGDLLFYGKGAGPGPAASAVAGDVILTCQDLLRGGSASGALAARGRGFVKRRLIPISETTSSYYFRIEAADRPGVLSRVTGILGRRGISISQIHQDRTPTSGRVPVYVTTHPTSHGTMTRALKEVLALREIGGGYTWLRML